MKETQSLSSVSFFILGQKIAKKMIPFARIFLLHGSS